MFNKIYAMNLRLLHTVPSISDHKTQSNNS